ncbi:hypothetical protein GA0115238_14311, partial [Streptomyces sp. di50b]
MDWRLFAQRMASMARDLLAEHTLDATLEQISRSAVELVDGCDAAGILVLSEGRVRSLAPTDPFVTKSDMLQGELCEGPCFDAARPEHPERLFRIPDLTVPPERWPHFVPR